LCSEKGRKRKKGWPSVKIGSVGKRGSEKFVATQEVKTAKGVKVLREIRHQLRGGKLD